MNIGIRRPDLFSGIGLFNPAPGALDGGDMLTKADLKLADEYINSTYIQITKGATDTVVNSNPTNYYNALKAAGIHCFIVGTWDAGSLYCRQRKRWPLGNRLSSWFV